MKPYPLLFKPDLKERVWGGRALSQFGFEMPDGPIGEAWMIADHPNGVSAVVNGELAGLGLDKVRERHGAAFFGTKGLTEAGRFPLLVKLLDCSDDLSVQVHPDNDYVKLPPGELGKTEMWYVLDAKPGAKIIYGLVPGTTRETLSQAIAENRIMEQLQEVEVHAGDSFYIPAGTVHALCKGVLVAEIQQNSVTTYRLYDYDRPGLDGKPRELHIEDSLNVIRYEGSGAARMSTENANPNEWLKLAVSPYFIVEKGVCRSNWELDSFQDSFTILVVCEGEGVLEWADGSLEIRRGNCLLIPAGLGDCVLQGSLTVLRSYIP